MSSGVYLRAESSGIIKIVNLKPRELENSMAMKTKLNSKTGRVDSRSSHRHVFIRCALFTGRPELAHAYDGW